GQEIDDSGGSRGRKLRRGHDFGGPVLQERSGVTAQTGSTSAPWRLMATDFMMCSTVITSRVLFCFSTRIPSQPANGPCLTRTWCPILRKGCGSTMLACASQAFIL